MGRRNGTPLWHEQRTLIVTITAELQERYKSEVDVDWVDTIVIKHPKITTIYACNYIEAITGNFDGASVQFLPIPFKVSLPNKEANGRQDFSIVISNVFNQGKAVLDAAIEDPKTPITLYYTVYILGNAEPQYDPPIELSLTDITLNESALTGTGTRSDIINLSFPRQIYRPESWPGLVRR